MKRIKNKLITVKFSKFVISVKTGPCDYMSQAYKKTDPRQWVVVTILCLQNPVSNHFLFQRHCK